MEHFQNHELEYIGDDYTDFEDNPFDEVNNSPVSGRSSVDDNDDFDSDFEDEIELVIFSFFVIFLALEASS